MSDKPLKTLSGPRDSVLLGGLVFGHGIVHWFEISFPVIMAEIVEDLSLSTLAAGSIMTVFFLVGGLATLPVGYATDTHPVRGTRLLAFSFLWYGAVYFLISLSPGLAILLITVSIMNIGSALWHPPAFSIIFHRFPRRRGLATTLHGAGASIGDMVGPITVGALMLLLTWRDTMRLGLLPAAALTIAFLLLFKPSTPTSSGIKIDLKSYLTNLRSGIKERSLLVLIVGATFHASGMVTVLAFLPIYVRTVLHMGPDKAGLFVALLMGTSSLSQPLLGLASDKWGRPRVILPSLLVLASVVPLIGLMDGWQLVVITAIAGVFLFSVVSLMSAMILDMAPPLMPASAIAASFAIGMGGGSVAPVLAGLVTEVTDISAAFFMAAGFFVAAMVTIWKASSKRAVAGPSLSPG